MLSIPSSKSEIQQKLAGNKSHSGLQAAYASIENQRSPHTATIVLVGLTGAGKSSTVNQLFKKDNLADVGEGASCSSDIIEYEINNIVLEDLNIKNATLRVIDTPGFGDTRNVDLDSQLIATLRHFLTNHHELKGKYPTIVLICGRFDENRYSGENSNYVKMLKGLHSIKSLFDPKRNNSVLCFTHFMNVKKNLRLNPGPRADDLASIAQQFLEIPHLEVVFGENEGFDYDLEEENGYFCLPNGDYYPYNLYKAIENITRNNSDRMGGAIVHKAFQDISKYEVRVASINKLLPVHNEKVEEANKIMQKIQFQLSSNQIMAYLENSWANISQNRKNDYPNTLLNIQRVFERQKICSLQDVPQDKSKILDLVTQIQASPLVPEVLAHAIGLNIPKLDITPIAGQSYQITNFEVIPNSIFESTGEFEFSPIGYLIPSHLRCEVHKTTSDICEFLSSGEEYINSRLRTMNVNGKVSVSAYGGNLNATATAGYNIFESTTDIRQNSKFSACREHTFFRLTLKNTKDLKLSGEFENAISALPGTFTNEDFNSVQAYKGFFARFGTHVVQSAFGGGAIEMYTSSHSSMHSDKVKDVRQWGCTIQAKFGEIFGLDFEMSQSDDSNYTHNTKSQGWNFSAYLKGGDMKFHSVNLGAMSQSNLVNMRAQWLSTLNSDPIMLTNKLQLVPLSVFIERIDGHKAKQVDLATRDLFNASLEYKPKPSPPPRPEVPPPPQPQNDCLRAGTKILMSDFTVKNIEDIRPEKDQILDRNLQPCNVLGMNHIYLGEKNFYSFRGDEQGFFTNGHVFLGQEGFYTVSKANLEETNPLLAKSLPCTEIRGEFPIFKFKNGGFQPEEITLVLDDTVYSPDTKVYYLIVDGSTGTYIANGYICHHEMPPLEKWPLTSFCLQKILTENKNLHKFISGKELNPENFFKVKLLAEAVSKRLTQDVKFKLESNPRICDGLKSEVVFVPIKYDEELKKILSNGLLSAFGINLYKCCGLFLTEFLEEKNSNMTKVLDLVNTANNAINEMIENNF